MNSQDINSKGNKIGNLRDAPAKGEASKRKSVLPAYPAVSNLPPLSRYSV